MPRVTVQLPIFNEMYVADRLIGAVCELEYPKDLLEIQVLGLHYLCPALVTQVRSEDKTVFGFRYDTLVVIPI